MEKKNKNLFLAKGKIKVSAKGYWFTAGGEKGSFGYYPHLKSPDRYPVYPDTQIHGDLRMSASWLSDLCDPIVSKDMTELIFGNPGRSRPALLRTTDLELCPDSKKTKKPEDFFEIKPRIQIKESTKTVQEHMLADRELAFLEGCILESQIYLGYFDEEEKLEQACDIVCASAKFLSGFGGFRSRGYGRGVVEVNWTGMEPVELPDTLENPARSSFSYFLTALVHFRNKPVEPGETPQVINSRYHISAGQIRGWFVKTYHDIFGDWPSWKDMAGINFSTLYPSDRNILAFPPPISTLKRENEEIEDRWGRIQEQKDKIKPLDPGTFVTCETPVPSVTDNIRKEFRMRNSMDEPFITKDDGLFVQEFVGKDTCFGGLVRMKNSADEFSKKAWFILENTKPVIKGTIFEPSTGDAAEFERGARAFLLTEPISFDFSMVPGAGSQEQIMLASHRRFNTTLRRPRRNRIVAEPGSVVTDSYENCSVPWSGFGKKIQPAKPEQPADDRSGSTQARFVEDRCEFKISRSQAGLLREYLNPLLSENIIRENLTARIKKYEEKSQEQMQKLLKKIKTRLDISVEDMRAFIVNYLEELAIHWWFEKDKEKDHEADRS
ncbi:MAG: hypothetical protein GY795_20505 [Desulfobacterales bacterium]|nr:hypothetical protein [Desulfobacterales bacterium]